MPENQCSRQGCDNEAHVSVAIQPIVARGEDGELVDPTLEDDYQPTLVYLCKEHAEEVQPIVTS